MSIIDGSDVKLISGPRRHDINFQRSFAAERLLFVDNEQRRATHKGDDSKSTCRRKYQFYFRSFSPLKVNFRMENDIPPLMNFPKGIFAHNARKD